jgi:hypothetical protein
MITILIINSVPWRSVVFKRQKLLSVVLVIASLFAAGTTIGTAIAGQRTATPKPQDKLALGEPEVKQLLLLMDTDKNGKISKQERMKFMEAEFDRLDKDKSGDLDVKDLGQSKLRVSHFTNVGKRRAWGAGHPQMLYALTSLAFDFSGLEGPRCRR